MPLAVTASLSIRAYPGSGASRPSNSSTRTSQGAATMIVFGSDQ
jgi:hypothetical protein